MLRIEGSWSIALFDRSPNIKDMSSVAWIVTLDDNSEFKSTRTLEAKVQ